MGATTRSWPLSSILLAAAGATLVVAGLYFIVVRPPLLPEDVRYMALPAAQFDAIRPRLELWLGHVFQVMGGYVLATGVLTITLAATSFRPASLEVGDNVDPQIVEGLEASGRPGAQKARRQTEKDRHLARRLRHSPHRSRPA